jgi:DNA-binding MarR family transcriptional regulator
MMQIENILKISKEELSMEIEKLRKNQFVLMSPQRLDEKLIKVYEILPEGIEAIDRTETDGFENTKFGESKPEVEILSIIDEIEKEIQDSQLEQTKKDSISKKISNLKDKLEI